MYSLTTLSFTEKAKNEVFRQLTGVIGSSISIRSYYYEEIKNGPPVSDDLILITAPFFADRIIPLINKKSKYIIARRSLNPSKLKNILQIPTNSEVLIVNDFFSSAQELALELETLNIKNIKHTPYNPDMHIDQKFQYAITTGEAELVPDYIPNVIDLGHRLISIMTIADILYYFTGSASCDNLVSSRYMRDFIKLSMELSEQYEQNKTLQKQLEAVIANFENGIIVTDQDNIVTFHNFMTSKILTKDNLLGKSLEEIFTPQELDNLLNSEFLQINDKTIYITKKEILLPQNNRAFLLSLEDLSKIQDVDEKYRKQKKYANHIAKYKFSNMVYKSSKMSQLIAKAKNFAKTSSTILITGESGTGKELLAQAIHNASPRKNAPFVALNCAALSDTLLESELFGYEEGAFTGARKGGKKGLFELAHTGTIFLDEIGDAPFSIQTKLLRVLQEKEIMKIAGDKIVPVDVRVIAATNKDLLKLVENNIFRRDLYYRLKVLPLEIPPLRERKEDIKTLLNYLIARLAKNRKVSPIITPQILQLLNSYHWPGNIRELENIAEYMLNIASISIDLEKDIKQVLKINTREAYTQINSLGIYYPNEIIKSEAIAILNILWEAKKKETPLLGRTKIKELLLKNDINLTVQQVKSRLELLSKNGLSSSYIGKGTTINKAGESYLLSLNEKARL